MIHHSVAIVRNASSLIFQRPKSSMENYEQNPVVNSHLHAYILGWELRRQTTLSFKVFPSTLAEENVKLGRERYYLN